MNPHSFIPDSETDDELCLTCHRPLDHPNHSESWHTPDRVFVDNLGQRWEWCGGQPETWAWRMTAK